jgi:hypothetical protein
VKCKNPLTSFCYHKLQSCSSGGPERTSRGDGTCTCRYSIWCSVFGQVQCVEGLNGFSESWDCGVAGDSACIGQCDDASSVTPPGQ